MKKIIYKIGLLLLTTVFVLSCTSPEPETNYIPATANYKYPTSVSLETSNITNSSFQFTYDVNGGGEGYYVVVEGGSDAPSSNDVLDGTAAGLISSGNFQLTGEPVTIDVFSGLCNESPYDVYAVQFTSDSFLSPTPSNLSVVTAAIDIAGEYTAFPAAFGADAPEYTATITAVPNTTNQFTIDSAWGPNFVAWATGDPGFEGAFIYSAVITINVDGSITIVGDDSWSAIGGTGTYDSSCINKFSYTLQQELFGSPFTVDVDLVQN